MENWTELMESTSKPKTWEQKTKEENSFGIIKEIHSIWQQLSVYKE